MNATESAQEKLIRDLANRELWLKILESAFGVLVVLVAFVGNLLVCLAVRRNPTLRIIPNYYIISLAASDMLMALIGMPLTAVTIISGSWVFGAALCQYQGFIGTVLGIASLLNIALTAVNRYFKIARNAQYSKIYTRKTTTRSIVVVWGVSLLVPVPYLATGYRYSYHPGKALCFFDLDDSSPYYAISTIFCFVVAPFCVIIICYFRVYTAVRKHNKNLATNDAVQRNRNFSIDEIKLTKMLFAIVLGFVICWCPFVVIDILGVIRGQFSLPRYVYCLYTLSAGLTSCVNPLIYTVMNSEFRKEFKTMLDCTKLRESPGNLQPNVGALYNMNSVITISANDIDARGS